MFKPGHLLLCRPIPAEIVEFCRYLAPSAEEQAQRQAAMDRIEAVVTSIWPKARLQAFGSFATGVPLLGMQAQYCRRVNAICLWSR